MRHTDESPTTGMDYESWGMGPEVSELSRISGDTAIFASASTGDEVSLWGGEFHDLGCGIVNP